MSLSIVNNAASLIAQNNLNNTASSLSKSLERLSSGLKISSGTDGPAALVISEQARAQITGLNAAVDNTQKAVSLAQTADGALNQINTLLSQVRGLAVDSANTNSNDATALAANQAQITNALSTINNIVTAQSGQNKLFANDSSDALSSLPIAPSSPADYAKVVAAYTKQSVVDFSQLSSLDVTSAEGAANAINLVDKAISDVSTARGQIGAFQSNTLEANANNLQASLQNTTAATSTIRDTDYASEIANFTKSQVMLQAGQTVLSNANQTSQLVQSLLAG